MRFPRVWPAFRFVTDNDERSAIDSELSAFDTAAHSDNEQKHTGRSDSRRTLPLWRCQLCDQASQ